MKFLLEIDLDMENGPRDGSDIATLLKSVARDVEHIVYGGLPKRSGRVVLIQQAGTVDCGKWRVKS